MGALALWIGNQPVELIQQGSEEQPRILNHAVPYDLSSQFTDSDRRTVVAVLRGVVWWGAMTSMPPRGAQGHDHETSEGKEGVGEEGRLHCLPIFDVPCTEGGRGGK